MKVVSISKEALVLRPTGTDNLYSRAFAFDVNIVPDKPTPKKLVIQRKVGRYLQTWEMSWRKFMQQTAIGDVALIDKTAFKYSSTKAA